jgi:hypothetical protein
VLGLQCDSLAVVANRFPTIAYVQVEPPRHERDAGGARESRVRARVVLPGVITAGLAREPDDHVAKRVGCFIELWYRGEHSLERERVGLGAIRGAIGEQRRRVDRHFASSLQRIRRVTPLLVAIGIRAVGGESDVSPHRGRERSLFDPRELGVELVDELLVTSSSASVSLSG